jgi:hypothetical protein
MPAQPIAREKHVARDGVILPDGTFVMRNGLFNPFLGQEKFENL